jgi:hypothetical protein
MMTECGDFLKARLNIEHLRELMLLVDRLVREFRATHSALLKPKDDVMREYRAAYREFENMLQRCMASYRKHKAELLKVRERWGAGKLSREELVAYQMEFVEAMVEECENMARLTLKLREMEHCTLSVGYCFSEYFGRAELMHTFLDNLLDIEKRICARTKRLTKKEGVAPPKEEDDWHAYIR